MYGPSAMVPPTYDAIYRFEGKAKRDEGTKYDEFIITVFQLNDSKIVRQTANIVRDDLVYLLTEPSTWGHVRFLTMGELSEDKCQR